MIRAWRDPRAGGGVLVLLAGHWLWSGLVYHWLHFRTINPAAIGFAGLFVAQAGLFVWAVRSPRARFHFDRSPRARLGLYPVFGLLFGLEYPRLPLFAVPCPTVLITAGLLLASSGLPRVLNLVPILWTAVGGSAAVLLGIRADLALLAAGALLVIDTFTPRVLILPNRWRAVD